MDDKIIEFTQRALVSELPKFTFRQSDDPSLGRRIEVVRNGDQASLIDAATGTILATANIPASVSVNMQIVRNGDALEYIISAS